MSDINSLIDALKGEDMSVASKTFDSIMADKVSDALDVRRVEVAQSLYTAQAAQEQPQTELGDANELNVQTAENEPVGSEEV